ncbi:hypothetical protein Y032_0220g2515 [Ancylostoma ceylanicum]|uniref:Uncharacterized protein n=1 Tax=Ancylostoma ceylanicum TaxID=53326 RepID=A0A016SI88_9BILA|nr:hypothetical protein Y032_0220g2515 [Ancylostoma ceylanicum]
MEFRRFFINIAVVKSKKSVCCESEFKAVGTSCPFDQTEFPSKTTCTLEASDGCDEDSYCTQQGCCRQKPDLVLALHLAK